MKASKLNYKAYIGVPFIVVFTLLTAACLIDFDSTFTGAGGGLMVISLLTFANLNFIFSVINIQNIIFDKHEITVTNLLGWGFSKKYLLSQVSGYYTGRYTYRGNTEHITYLVINDKKIARLSGSYHQNFADVMAVAEERLTNLGEIRITAFSDYTTVINPKLKQTITKQTI